MYIVNSILSKIHGVVNWHGISTLHTLVMSVIIKWLVSKKGDNLQSLETKDDPFPILPRFKDLKTQGSSSSRKVYKGI